jgi:hypothetical protein
VLAAGAGTLTVAALYGAAREAYSSRAATLAALLLAVAFLHVRDSHFGVTDVPATLLAVCAFWAAARCFSRGPTMRRVAVAGALCGLAASTKYTMALTLMPLLVAILAHVRGPGNGISMAWRFLAVAVSCAAGGFLLGTSYALLDSPKFLADFNAERLHFVGGGGTWVERGWVHHLTFNLRYGLGLSLLSAAMAGAAWLCMERSWRTALLLSFPCAYYAAMGTGFTVFARYMVPLVPFACLGAAILVDRIGVRMSEGGHSPGLVAGLVSVLAVLLALPGAAQDLAFDRLLSQPDTRILAARWVERTYPSGLTMYQTGAVYGHIVPQPASRYAQFGFDEPQARFVRDGDAATTFPELIAVLESPLAQFSKVPTQVRSLLSRDYVLRVTFEATRPDGARPLPYDQQDAFFVPFDRPGEATRPGPTLKLYERVTTHVALKRTRGGLGLP